MSNTSHIADMHGSPLAAIAYIESRSDYDRFEKGGPSVKLSQFFKSVVEAESHNLRLSFARAATFQLYTACISAGSVPSEFSAHFSSSPDETITIPVRPFVNKVEMLGGLVKTMFSSKPTAELQALPCRVEDQIGSGIGLMLIVDDQPTIIIGQLDESNGLFMRQIQPASGTTPETSASGMEIGKRYASVVPIESGSLHLRKEK